MKYVYILTHIYIQLSRLEIYVVFIQTYITFMSIFLKQGFLNGSIDAQGVKGWVSGYPCGSDKD